MQRGVHACEVGCGFRDGDAGTQAADGPVVEVAAMRRDAAKGSQPVGTKISGWLRDVGAFHGLRERQHAGDLVGVAIDFEGAIAERGAAAETLPEGAADDDLRGAVALVAGLGEVVAEGEAGAEGGEEVLRDFDDLADLAAQRRLRRWAHQPR